MNSNIHESCTPWKSTVGTLVGSGVGSNTCLNDIVHAKESVLHLELQCSEGI